MPAADPEGNLIFVIRYPGVVNKYLKKMLIKYHWVSSDECKNNYQCFRSIKHDSHSVAFADDSFGFVQKSLSDSGQQQTADKQASSPEAPG